MITYKTYEAGVLQARAYRKLRAFMSSQLRKHDLTMMQWALLGMVVDNRKSGITIGTLAHILEVEPPLVTNMVNDAIANGMLMKQTDTKDRRVRIVLPTDKCINRVNKVEKQLRGEFKVWVKSINSLQLAGYIKTLKQIADLEV